MRTRSEWNEYLEMRASLERDFGPRSVASFPADPEHWYWTWWGEILDYDPIPHWRRLEVPALFVCGELDDNAPVVRCAERIRTELAGAAGDFTVWVLPDTGHSLMAPGTNELLPEFVELLTTWIHERTAPDHTVPSDAAGVRSTPSALRSAQVTIDAAMTSATTFHHVGPISPKCTVGTRLCRTASVADASAGAREE